MGLGPDDVDPQGVRELPDNDRTTEGEEGDGGEPRRLRADPLADHDGKGEDAAKLREVVVEDGAAEARAAEDALLAELDELEEHAVELEAGLGGTGVDADVLADDPLDDDPLADVEVVRVRSSVSRASSLLATTGSGSSASSTDIIEVRYRLQARSVGWIAQT